MQPRIGREPSPCTLAIQVFSFIWGSSAIACLANLSCCTSPYFAIQCRMQLYAAPSDYIYNTRSCTVVSTPARLRCLEACAAPAFLLQQLADGLDALAVDVAVVLTDAGCGAVLHPAAATCKFQKSSLKFEIILKSRVKARNCPQFRPQRPPSAACQGMWRQTTLEGASAPCGNVPCTWLETKTRNNQLS